MKTVENITVESGDGLLLLTSGFNRDVDNSNFVSVSISDNVELLFKVV